MRRVLLLLVIVGLLVACGKKGPLIYPDLLVPGPPTAVVARQAGLGVRLSFVIPDKDRGGQSLKGVAGIKIFKRELGVGQEPACKACSDDYKLYRTLYLEPLDINARRYGNKIVLQDSDVAVGMDCSYKIVPFMKDGLEGDSSEPAHVVMVQPPPAPEIRAVFMPTEIRITFAGSSARAEGFAGYNLYRATAEEPVSYLPINKEPITAATYTDSALKLGVTYRYAARTLQRTAAGTLVESVPSNEVAGKLTEEE